MCDSLIYYPTLILDINSGGLNILIPEIFREVRYMAKKVNSGNGGAADSYDALFAALAFALLLATALLAVGGIYYSFINPVF